MPRSDYASGGNFTLGNSCLAERLGHYVRLSPGELASLAHLEDQAKEFRRGSVVIRENERPRELYIIEG